MVEANIPESNIKPIKKLKKKLIIAIDPGSEKSGVAIKSNKLLFGGHIRNIDIVTFIETGYFPQETNIKIRLGEYTSVTLLIEKVNTINFKTNVKYIKIQQDLNKCLMFVGYLIHRTNYINSSESNDYFNVLEIDRISVKHLFFNFYNDYCVKKLTTVYKNAVNRYLDGRSKYPKYLVKIKDEDGKFIDFKYNDTNDEYEIITPKAASISDVMIKTLTRKYFKLDKLSVKKIKRKGFGNYMEYHSYQALALITYYLEKNSVPDGTI